MKIKKNYIYAVLQKNEFFHLEAYEVTKLFNMQKCAILKYSSYYINKFLGARIFNFISIEDLTSIHETNVFYFKSYNEIRTFFKTEIDAHEYLKKAYDNVYNTQINEVRKQIEKDLKN